MPKLTGRNVLQTHKLGQITHLLTTYPAKRFILLGDSSQRDPEIYQQALAQFPGRIAAIYIRDVTGEARDGRVISIGHAIQAQGVPFAYAGETRILSDEAKRIGLIKA
jgi:phosphatidate phosphatase APP1